MASGRVGRGSGWAAIHASRASSAGRGSLTWTSSDSTGGRPRFPRMRAPPILVRFHQPHAGPLAVLLDEDHAGRFEAFANETEVERSRPWLARFEGQNSLLADADPKREPHPGPAEQLARRLDLLGGEWARHSSLLALR